MTLGNDQRAGKGCVDAQETEGQIPLVTEGKEEEGSMLL